MEYLSQHKLLSYIRDVFRLDCTLNTSGLYHAGPRELPELDRNTIDKDLAILYIQRREVGAQSTTLPSY